MMELMPTSPAAWRRTAVCDTSVPPCPRRDPVVDPVTGPVTPVRARTRERGFSLIEMVVVVLIMALLMSFIVMKMTGAKRTTHYRVATSAAIAYAEAVESYMADNGQVPPALGSEGWPTTTRDDLVRGPVNTMLVESGKAKPYASKGMPEPVNDGLVDIGSSKSSAVADARAFITYTIVGDEYSFLVETIPNDPSEAVLSCVVTNSATPPAGVQRCG